MNAPPRRLATSLFFALTLAVCAEPAIEVKAVADSKAGGLALAEQIAQELRIPRTEFRDITIKEALSFLRRQSVTVLGPQQNLALELVTAGDPDRLPRLSLSLENKSLNEILQAIAQQTGLEVRYGDPSVLLYPKVQMGALVQMASKDLNDEGWSRLLEQHPKLKAAEKN